MQIEQATWDDIGKTSKAQLFFCCFCDNFLVDRELDQSQSPSITIIKCPCCDKEISILKQFKGDHFSYSVKGIEL